MHFTPSVSRWLQKCLQKLFSNTLHIRKLSAKLSPYKKRLHIIHRVSNNSICPLYRVSNNSKWPLRTTTCRTTYPTKSRWQPMFSIPAFFAVLAVQRDALMVSFFMGAITNLALSKVLKKILNQDRPADTVSNAVEKPSDKGMPSSHAMSLGFIETFTMLALEWTSILLPVYVAISLYYRVQTRLHTVEQVAVGMVFGVTNGFVWRHLVDGSNPFGIHIMDFVSNNFLNDQGLLPIPLLVVPALAGVVIVGSRSKCLKKKAASQFSMLA